MIEQQKSASLESKQPWTKTNSATNRLNNKHSINLDSRGRSKVIRIYLYYFWFELTSSPHYAGEIEKRCFYSKNASYASRVLSAAIPGHFEFVLRKALHRDIIVLKKLQSAWKCFVSPLKRKCAFSNNSGLKSVFEKVCFRNGFVLTVGRTEGINPCFQILDTVWFSKFKVVITYTVGHCITTDIYSLFSLCYLDLTLNQPD